MWLKDFYMKNTFKIASGIGVTVGAGVLLSTGSVSGALPFAAAAFVYVSLPGLSKWFEEAAHSQLSTWLLEAESDLKADEHRPPKGNDAGASSTLPQAKVAVPE